MTNPEDKNKPSRSSTKSQFKEGTCVSYLKSHEFFLREHLESLKLLEERIKKIKE